LEEAERNYRKALEICEEFNDRYNQARTYHQLGRIAEEKRDFENIRTNYFKALECINGFDDQEMLSIILSSIARLYHTTRDQELIYGTASILGMSEKEVSDLFHSLKS